MTKPNPSSRLAKRP